MQPTLSSLPGPTEDLKRVQADLSDYGIALLANALSPSAVDSLSAQLANQAELERQHGSAFLEDGNLGRLGEGPNQRVFSLISKGEDFRALAKDNHALGVIRNLFASSYPLPSEMIEQAELNAVLLSSLSANIVHKGGVEMMKHADQAFMPPSTPYAAVINVIWLLDDFTAANGATLVAPVTHLEPSPHKFYMESPDMMPLEASAGTAVFLDGRTWHATGVNTTGSSRSAIFAYYCRPFMRQQENFSLSLTPNELDSFDDELLGLLGFKVWFTLGGVEGSPNGTLVKATHR